MASDDDGVDNYEMSCSLIYAYALLGSTLQLTRLRLIAGFIRFFALPGARIFRPLLAPLFNKFISSSRRFSSHLRALIKARFVIEKISHGIFSRTMSLIIEESLITKSSQFLELITARRATSDHQKTLYERRYK